MPKQMFVPHKFSAESEKTITFCNEILEGYRRQDFRISLRQLFYQLVHRNYVANTTRTYKNLGNLVSDARKAGLIDWAMIEDRNRDTVIPTHWLDPAHIISAAASQFRIDKWADQPMHIECMVEKDALSGVLEPVCRELDIGLTANKGYSSSSTMYEIGRRLALKHSGRKRICVIYLGDHDPSGIDMTRDIGERLKMYSEVDDLEIVRVALNYDQVELWQPPENPAKETDSRFKAYCEEFGVTSSWELDAVEPVTLAGLIRGVVAERRDDTLWERAVRTENQMRGVMRNFVTQYEAGNIPDAEENEEPGEDEDDDDQSY